MNKHRNYSMNTVRGTHFLAHLLFATSFSNTYKKRVNQTMKFDDYKDAGDFLAKTKMTPEAANEFLDDELRKKIERLKKKIM